MRREIFVLLGIVLFLGVGSADILSMNSGGGLGIIVNPAQLIEGFFFQMNGEPFDPIPFLSSVDLSNESDSNLNCSFQAIDEDGDNMTAEVIWIKDGVNQFSLNYTSIVNGSYVGAILDSGNLTLRDIWKCSVKLYDEFDYSNEVESNELEIIDITDPVVLIVSPEQTNYSTLNITMNVSVIENENVSMCFYDLDSFGNETMQEINDSYYFSEPSLGPGPHDVWFYCNDTSGNWGMNYTNFTIENEAAIAISLSDLLLTSVKWNVESLPADDLGAIGNNFENETEYFINISATNTLVDLYVRADGDLTNGVGDLIGLGNESYSVSENDSTVSGIENFTMSTNYNLIGSSLGDSSVVYMKFYLDAPASQSAGEYLNQLQFKAVRVGQAV